MGRPFYDAGSRMPLEDERSPPSAERSTQPRAPSASPYVELAVRSNFSFLRGASSPEALVVRARELGYDAIAITDFAGLYGSVRAMQQAEECSLRLVLGCEVPLEGSAQERERTVLIHVSSHEGYRHLCRILSEAHERCPKPHGRGDVPNVPAAIVAAHAAGLFCTVPGSLDHRDLARLKEAFGDRLSLGVYRHLDGEDARREREAVEASEAFGAAIVAHNAVRFADGAQKPVLDVLHCIREGVTLDEAGRELLPNAEARLRSPDEMAAIFADRPEWIARTRVIAGACAFSLRELKYKFPCDVPLGETPDSMLRRLAYEGAASRWGGEPPEGVRAMIEKELALIAKLDVASYFLSVRAIVDIARERDILCQGRGSAANSAVCYCLGVTAVDPSRSKLLFERFLSPERREPPDIDVDFEHERREEVIQEIYRRYGRGNAAMVSEVICYRGKSALREVGKVFGFSLEQIDQLSNLVSWWESIPEGGPGASERVQQAGLDPSDARVAHCLKMARAIRGFPRHLSIHVGGFILSAEPLENIAPVEPATMPDRTVVPWDKDDIDTLGFFKVDVLGLGMLTAIRKALWLVERTNAEQGMGMGMGRTAMDLLAAIPPEDPVVYDALCRADTVGVFQIESRAQMAMLPRLRPRKFYDLVIEVAIVRPGPIQGGMVHPYLRRRNGEEEIDVPHELLRPILERTLGVPLFQEQVMQIAIAGAGYSGGEADQLRRDMAAWKRNGKLARHKERLQRGFRERGISEEFGERLYKQIQGFAEYGFPESHAASFALLVYASAWLKVHHPAAFAAALVNSQPMGFYSVSTILKDAQHHGVEVLPICVECSDWDCTLQVSAADLGGSRGGRLCGPPLPEGDEERSEETEGGARGAEPPSRGEPQANPFRGEAPQARGGRIGPLVRLGLRQVKGLGEEVGKRIEAARRERAFDGVEDLRARARLDQKEMDALAEAGALNGLALASTREAMWRVRAPRGEGLFAGMEGDGELPPLPRMTRAEQLVLDFERTGLSIGDHPMRLLRDRLPKEVLDSRSLAAAREREKGRRVTTAGMVICRQRPGTASGVVFITMEDEHGFINLVLWAKVFDRLRRVATTSSLLLAKGKIDVSATVAPLEGSQASEHATEPVVYVIVDQLESLALPNSRGARVPGMSRDFH